MLAEGELLAGRYRMDRPLADGGMSQVWHATDEVLDRPVAIKVIRPGLLAQPGFAERFAAEARILAGLRHPGIVGVHDYGEAPTAYLVMEFVDGEPLSDRIAREGRLSAQDTMAIVAQSADALQAAHEAGVVHRDIKPANLLVRPDGTVVVVDFGVAKAQLSAGLTQTDTVLGTARYMSPEQVKGGQITATTDVYALGAVAYECLTGTPPFDADSPVAIALKQVSEEAPPLPSTVPGPARAVVARALAKDPADRYPDAASLAAAARTASRTDATATAPLPVVAPALRRRSALIAGAGVAAAAVGALVLAFALSAGDAVPTVPLPTSSVHSTTGVSGNNAPGSGSLTRSAGPDATAGPSAAPSPDRSAAKSSAPQPTSSPAAPPSPSPEPESSTPAESDTSGSPAAPAAASPAAAARPTSSG